MPSDHRFEGECRFLEAALTLFGSVHLRKANPCDRSDIELDVKTGHRETNAALDRAVIVRMRLYEPTIKHVARRTAEGLSKRNINRCLKRYLAHEIYQAVMTDYRARRTTREVRPSEVLTSRDVHGLMESIIGLYKTEVIATDVFHDGPVKTLGCVEHTAAGWVDWWNYRRATQLDRPDPACRARAGLVGRLEPIPPSEVWPHEAWDFTRWLVERAH